MSEALGLEVVAEGVETAAHRAFLVQHGCQFCQGYLLGRPVPIACVFSFSLCNNSFVFLKSFFKA